MSFFIFSPIAIIILLYGIVTCPMKKRRESMLERTEMQRVGLMCGTLLREKKTRVELRDRMGIEAFGSALKRNRLRWFGRVERKDKEDLVRECMYMMEGNWCVLSLFWFNIFKVFKICLISSDSGNWLAYTFGDSSTGLVTGPMAIRKPSKLKQYVQTNLF